MSEMTATRMRSRHSLVIGAAVLAAAIAWVAGVVLLWRTEVPSGLSLPELDPRDYFTAAELDETADYERFLYVNWALSIVATLAALAVLSVRAPRWAGSLGHRPDRERDRDRDADADDAVVRRAPVRHRRPVVAASTTA